MKLQNNISKLSLFVVGAVLSACGGTSNPLERPTAASGTMTSAIASGLAGQSFTSKFGKSAVGIVDGSAYGASTSVSMMSVESSQQQALSDLFATTQAIHASVVGTNGSSPSLHTMTDSMGCDPTKTPATPVDADSDGIYATATLSYSCSVDFLGTPASVSGTITMTDKDDTTKFGGFSVGLSNLAVDIPSLMKTTINATITGTKGTSTYTGVFDMAADITAAQSSGNGTVGIYTDITVTPTDMTAPSDAGAVSTFSGFVKYKGSGNGQSIDLVLSYVGANLTYVKSGGSCAANGFNAGTLTMTDGAAHHLVATFGSDCTATYTFDGASVTPAL